MTQGAREWRYVIPPAKAGEIKAVEHTVMAWGMETVGNGAAKKRRTRTRKNEEDTNKQEREFSNVNNEGQ